MKRLAWSILLTFPFCALATEVYRSVDENGHVVYSDRPGELTERVVVRPVVDTFAASSARESGDDNRAQATAADPSLAGVNSGETASQDDAAERARNCEVARERAETYSMSRRLFRTLPDGEREYLSDAEIEDARTRAQSDVANWCD